MNNKILISGLLALGLSLANAANAQNSHRYSWWGFFGNGNSSCHSHQYDNSGHYFWSRFFPWHHHCPNESPEADAGEDQSANVDDLVTLDGSASSDSDGSIRRYSWYQTTGPRARLDSRYLATPTFTAPDVTEATDLVFVLIVTDNAGKTDRDQITVTEAVIQITILPNTYGSKRQVPVSA